jgi:hypothetical protein
MKDSAQEERNTLLTETRWPTGLETQANPPKRGGSLENQQLLAG